MDLATLLDLVLVRLPGLFAQTGDDPDWQAPVDLIATLLGDDPGVIVEAPTNALESGAMSAAVSQALAHAAALRVAHFHNRRVLRLDHGAPEPANRTLVAVARYRAAHAPTSQSVLQTAQTARRLARGEALFESTS